MCLGDSPIAHRITRSAARMPREMFTPSATVKPWAQPRERFSSSGRSKQVEELVMAIRKLERALPRCVTWPPGQDVPILTFYEIDPHPNNLSVGYQYIVSMVFP